MLPSTGWSRATAGPARPVLVDLVVEASVTGRVRRGGRPLPVQDRLPDRAADDLEVRLVHGVVGTDLDVAVLAVHGRVDDVEALEALPVGAAHERVPGDQALRAAHEDVVLRRQDRKSTRLNSSHVKISYA